MDHQAQGAAKPRELGSDGVDEEGHVIGDDLDDGTAAGPAVSVVRGRMNAHARRAGWPLAAQLHVGDHRAEEIRGASGLEVLGGDVPVVDGGEFLEQRTARCHALDLAQDGAFCVNVTGQRHGRRLLEPSACVSLCRPACQILHARGPPGSSSVMSRAPRVAGDRP